MSVNLDVNALNKLKDASLWFIIATLIGFIGVVTVFSEIISIVAFILLLFVAIPKLKDAFNLFLQTGKDVRNGITGANILPWGYIIIFLGGIIGIVGLFAISAVLAIFGTLLVVLGVLLEFIGGLLIGLSIYNLGRFYQSDLMWIGGILIIIPGINFVGWILTYISIDDVLKRLSPSPIIPTPAASMPSVSVYQVGTGSLSADGKASLVLYSSTQLQIQSASIDNTLISVSWDKITPYILNPGNNTVTIQFPPLTGFIRGSVYSVTLVLSNGQTVKVFLTFT
ncbi:DUF973 family protein [Sulfurisphaera ohwakuensis]|uniref:DUF973 family protein n=1 Tax=Sulfurisphaera ohwakuensis TaxID=69656 RepID=UPI0036F329E5